MGFFIKIRSVFGKSAPAAPEPAPAAPPMPELVQDTPPPAAQAPVDRRRRKRRDARRGTRVLIIDDSATVVAAMKKFLASVGYVTYEAADAESGIDLACTHGPQLIFLDIILPGMNGFAALRQLRRDPRTKDIPVIMMSGNEQAAEQFYATRIGADDFIKKPFTRGDLFVRIESLLDDQQIPRHVKRQTAPHTPA